MSDFCSYSSASGVGARECSRIEWFWHTKSPSAVTFPRKGLQRATFRSSLRPVHQATSPVIFRHHFSFRHRICESLRQPFSKLSRVRHGIVQLFQLVVVISLDEGADCPYQSLPLCDLVNYVDASLNTILDAIAKLKIRRSCRVAIRSRCSPAFELDGYVEEEQH